MPDERLCNELPEFDRGLKLYLQERMAEWDGVSSLFAQPPRQVSSWGNPWGHERADNEVHQVTTQDEKENEMICTNAVDQDLLIFAEAGRHGSAIKAGDLVVSDLGYGFCSFNVIEVNDYTYLAENYLMQGRIFEVSRLTRSTIGYWNFKKVDYINLGNAKRLGVLETHRHLVEPNWRFHQIRQTRRNTETKHKIYQNSRRLGKSIMMASQAMLHFRDQMISHRRLLSSRH